MRARIRSRSNFVNPPSTVSISRSKSTLIAAFPAAEIAVEVLPGFRARPVLVLHGMAYDRDQGQAVWQARIGALNSWARSARGL
jgi:hypothetical protein